MVLHILPAQVALNFQSVKISIACLGIDSTRNYIKGEQKIFLTLTADKCAAT